MTIIVAVVVVIIIIIKIILNKMGLQDAVCVEFSATGTTSAVKASVYTFG